MACKLYYGNGEVTIEGAAEIRGVEISYKGAITITKSCGDNFHIVANTNKIMVFPLGEGFLNNLFTYSGTLIINSVLVADNNGERVSCIIKRVLDYSELLDSNAEDLTVFSENLKSSYNFGGSPIKTTTDDIAINNLLSDGGFYLSDGSPYSGLYHIHLEDSACMTGPEHTEESQDLYFKQTNRDGSLVNRLIATRNPSHVPPAIGHYRRQKRVTKNTEIKRSIRKTGGTGGTGGGGGY